MKRKIERLEILKDKAQVLMVASVTAAVMSTCAGVALCELGQNSLSLTARDTILCVSTGATLASCATGMGAVLTANLAHGALKKEVEKERKEQNRER